MTGLGALRGDARALAAEIEAYRKARRLTPAEASREIGCSTSQMSRWRRGGGISMSWLEKVAAWMRRPLVDLLPLAGYPALDVRRTPSILEPTDNGFRAVKAAWPHLPAHRREVLVELAAGIREPADDEGHKATRRLTAVIEREGDGYVALCPEVDVATQGDTIEQARANLQEALELFFEKASQAEIAERLHGEVYVTTLEVAIG